MCSKVKILMVAVVVIWAAVIVSAGYVCAEEFKTEIQFSYFGTGQKAATSYMVRNDGAPVCQITPGPDLTCTPDSYVANCTSEAFNEGDNNITMLANLVDGGLSPASAVYPFYIEHLITVMRITIERADGSSSTVSFPVTVTE